MTERAYTVREIDDLRSLCETKWLFGTFSPYFPPLQPIHDKEGKRIGYGGGGGGGGDSRSYKQMEKDAGVEQLVRTYMLAGITAEQIRAEHKAQAPTSPPEPMT